jgi:D-alanyl-D-alanine carboxypeptidase/D-alanyl-D-alanine-endopeptidase (penicillin-binding protein 4)
MVMLGCGGVALAGPLPAPVAAELERHGIPLSSVSIYVRPVAASTPVVAVNEALPRNPASVIKLLTTLTALDLLGPAYTWRTEAYLQGPVTKGRLNGDLILKGGGDPYLTPEAFWQFLRGVRERGVQIVAGDVVIDNGYFEPPEVDRGAFDGRAERAYNAIPAALTVNFQTTQIHLFHDPSAGAVRVFTDPPLANLQVTNGLEVVDAPCVGKHHDPQLAIVEGDAQATLRVSGTFASRCREASYPRLLLDATSHSGGAFLAVWEQLGGKVEGRIRAGTVPNGAVLVHAAESRPLAEVVRGINKWSNNVMSRALFLTLGAAQFGPPGTRVNGQRAVQAWLAKNGLQFPELVVDNGSGLSRETRIAAQSLARLLAYAYASPVMPEFMSSLPVVGVDGTMRTRLEGKALAGRAHVKTGSLDGVSAMAGYALDARGNRWIVVAMINDPRVQPGQGRQVQDALLTWVHDQAALAGGGDKPVAFDPR